MAGYLHELLDTQSDVRSPQTDDVAARYLDHISQLPLDSLIANEPQSLSRAAQSIHRSLQALSKRSYQAIVSSTDHLTRLHSSLPELDSCTSRVQDAVPDLSREAISFAQRYNRSADNPVLDRRKNAMLLANNVDRVSDILELPVLLASSVAAAAGTSSIASITSSVTAQNYCSTALDVNVHVKRLRSLYPNSGLITSISLQAEDVMKDMTLNLVTALKVPAIKLAGAMRIVSWLRRVSPELDEAGQDKDSRSEQHGEGSLGALFLVSRLSSLLYMLEALDPLKQLADQESRSKEKSLYKQSKQSNKQGGSWPIGQSSERYLKRYVEILREQSFAIISMYKTIFPSSTSVLNTSTQKVLGVRSSTLPSIQPQVGKATCLEEVSLVPIPSALSTFSMHLVDLVMDALKTYMPNVRDRSARESLLTQVSYCAGSLGRLGGDFSLMLATLEDIDDDNETSPGDDTEEWIEMIRRHRIQSSRLEILASGVGGARLPSDNPSHDEAIKPT